MTRFMMMLEACYKKLPYIATKVKIENEKR